MITEQMIKVLQESDYFDIREIPNRGICALGRLFSTIALYYTLDETGYIGRYCYKNLADAKEAIAIWDGAGAPSGPWIKHKGYLEYSNLQSLNEWE